MEIRTYILYIASIVMCLCGNADFLEKNFYMQSASESLKVISELPALIDLQDYLGSLRLLVQYLSRNKDCVDFGMKFALFLLNVNLRSFVEENSTLPLFVRNDLQYLTSQADALHKGFDLELAIMKSSQPVDYDITAMYVSMLTNDTQWSKQILKLDLELLKEVYSYSYDFPEWEQYLVELNDLAKWMPNIELSNSCLEMLSKNYDVAAGYPNCDLKQDCLEMLDYGINFGYALSFKLLYLILARLSLGCTVFSVLQDERVRHHLCKAAYRESEYIADNHFKKIDLMAEHTSFCTLDGHAQFIRKPWISSFLKHQTPHGYFTSNPVSWDDQKAFWKTSYTFADACLEHINAAVVGALSAAVRFVLENYH